MQHILDSNASLLIYLILFVVKGSLAGKHPCCGLFDIMRITKKKEQNERVVIIMYNTVYVYIHVLK